MPSPLQGHGEPPLVSGTGASLPARLDLGTVGQVPSKPSDILVVNVVDLVDAEGAYLASRRVTRLSSLGTAPHRARRPSSGRPTTAGGSAAGSSASLLRLSHLVSISLNNLAPIHSRGRAGLRRLEGNGVQIVAAHFGSTLIISRFAAFSAWFGIKHEHFRRSHL